MGDAFDAWKVLSGTLPTHSSELQLEGAHMLLVVQCCTSHFPSFEACTYFFAHFFDSFTHWDVTVMSSPYNQPGRQCQWVRRSKKNAP
jgi:hypothetical protein